ncbi:MAG: hypothetical protein MR266_03700 [Erysipelotrichaceae bacterium]|nr:hypothetical protein [Erysipelotrichaceae bacterium]
MQDKLINLLEIKIEAIEKNIDNLNYLNNELSRNQDDLEYISEELNVFNDNDVLEFDKILIDDFKKILEMIDPKGKEIFENKTCNYQGIMYIIKGIRDGISLELTTEQTNAILELIELMKTKKEELKNIIKDLLSNKEKLPETDMEKLELSLNTYKEIIANLKENKYLTEIEEVIDALDFSSITMEEKIDIFAYILKYNRDIYKSNNNSKENKDDSYDFDEVKVSELKEPEFFTEDDFKLPKVSEINNKVEENKINDNLDLEEIIKKIDERIKELDEITVEDEKESNELESSKIEDNKLDDNVVAGPIQTFDLPNEELKVDAEKKFNEEQDIETRNILAEEMFNFNNLNELKNDTRSETLNNQVDQVEESLNPLENVDNSIQSNQIEEKQEGMEDFDNLENTQMENLSESKEESLNQESDVVGSLTNQVEENVNKLENIKTLLNSYQLLDTFNEYHDVMENITNLDLNNLKKCLEIIQNDLSGKNDNLKNIVEVILKTLPSVFMKNKLLNTFIDDISFYKEHNINLINLFDNYRELLIINTDILKRNYEIVKKYELELNNDNVKYLLCNVNLITNLDYYIEAIGHEKAFLGKEQVFDGSDYIKKYPYKLNMISRDTLLKLRYSTDNNLRIFGSKPGILAGEVANPKVDILVLPEEYKNLYFNYEYEFIDRSEMTNLLLDIKNSTDFNLEIDEYLEKLDNAYKINDLRYKINNLYFSRIKTIRVYNYLKTRNVLGVYALIIALTYQSVITKDEYKSIETLITKLVEGGN